MITGMNHAVLYVRDARRQQHFYEEVLGFETIVADADGAFVFLRAPGSANHHDLACFTIGEAAGDSTAGRQQVGLYHLAWEVPTLADLEAHRLRLAAAGALHGASDHGVNKSLYAKDPDGIEFEVMWLVPPDAWGDEEHQAIVRPLDIAADIARYGADRESTSHLPRTADPAGAPTSSSAVSTNDQQRSPVSLDQLAENNYCYFLDDDAFVDTDRPGFRRRIINGENLQLCFWRITAGTGGSFMHNHEHNEQLGIIMRGALDFRIGNADDPRRTVLQAGDVYLAPVNIWHGDSVFSGDDEHDECWILDVFSPPRDDMMPTPVPAKAAPSASADETETNS
jgi:catechol 2,3-dioxygenase-like lactoylglutathione lyase family enzyme